MGTLIYGACAGAAVVYSVNDFKMAISSAIPVANQADVGIASGDWTLYSTFMYCSPNNYCDYKFQANNGYHLETKLSSIFQRFL